MRLLALIGLLALAAVIAGGVYFFGGFYSVAANAEDPTPVNWALVKVRTASIDRYAKDNPPANLNDDATVQEGAREYLEHGCQTCHGAPGVKWAKFSEGLHPDPPDLKEVAGELSPQQIFWVIKNGINMTGMPSFAAAGAKDEDLWKIAAFVKKLPSVKDADFKNWTAPAAAPAAAPAPAAQSAPAPTTPAPAAPAPENKQ
jgi:cytochrome c553